MKPTTQSLGQTQYRVPVDSVGYRDLDRWARSWGHVASCGVEGTGSFGAGLSSFLRRQGHRVIEVNRGDRRARRANGKSDTLDAELVARSVLSGTSSSVPKSADGLVEVIRQIKVPATTPKRPERAPS
jgi:transposase